MNLFEYTFTNRNDDCVKIKRIEQPDEENLFHVEITTYEGTVKIMEDESAKVLSANKK